MRRLSLPAGLVALSMLAYAQSGPPGKAVCAQLISLKTTDGVSLDGALYRAPRPRPIALLLVHGYGGEYYGGYFPALAQAAAEQGFTTLALNMRDHGAGPKTADFADNATDIAAGVNYLRREVGAGRVALLGQSIGTNRVLYYGAVNARADSGIAATVLVSGPGNMFEWNVWQFGKEKAQADVAQALKLAAAGRGRELMLVDLGPLGKALYSADYLLSVRGPLSKSDPYANLKVVNPVLIIYGRADRLVQPDIGQRLQRAAAAGARVELFYIEDADHGFRGKEALLFERVLGWLKQVAP